MTGSFVRVAGLGLFGVALVAGARGLWAQDAAAAQAASTESADTAGTGRRILGGGVDDTSLPQDPDGAGDFTPYRSSVGSVGGFGGTDGSPKNFFGGGHSRAGSEGGGPGGGAGSGSGFNWSRFLTDTTRTGMQFALPRLASGGQGGGMGGQAGGGMSNGGMSSGGMGGGAMGGPGGGGMGMGGGSMFQVGSSLLRSAGMASSGALGNSLTTISRISALPATGLSVPVKSGMFDLHMSVTDLIGGSFLQGLGQQSGGGQGMQGGGGANGMMSGGMSGGSMGGGSGGGPGGGHGGGGSGPRVSLQLKF